MNDYSGQQYYYDLGSYSPAHDARTYYTNEHHHQQQEYLQQQEQSPYNHNYYNVQAPTNTGNGLYVDDGRTQYDDDIRFSDNNDGNNNNNNDYNKRIDEEQYRRGRESSSSKRRSHSRKSTKERSSHKSSNTRDQDKKTSSKSKSKHRRSKNSTPPRTSSKNYFPDDEYGYERTTRNRRPSRNENLFPEDDRREDRNIGERSSSDYYYTSRMGLDQAPLTSPRSEFEPTLSWRLDPDESLSDWTILVRTSNGGLSSSSPTSTGRLRSDQRNHNVDAFDGENSLEEGYDDDDDDDDNTSQESFTVRYFYVHKIQLAVGPRRSEYFARLFKTRQNSRGFDVDDNVSRIELKPSAADAFPAMLDFLYSAPGEPVDVTTESAVALRHLATCFGVRQLFYDVTEFIQNDLNSKTCVIYAQEAYVYGHEKLTSASVKICASHFSSVKLSRLVTLDPQLFHKIVTSQHFKCDSETYSHRFCAYLRCQSYIIQDQGFLLSLTTPSIMPHVAQSDALFLISVLVQLGMVPGGKTRTAEGIFNNNEGNGNNTFLTDYVDDGGPTLYQRCAEAAAVPVRLAVENLGRSSLLSKRRTSNMLGPSSSRNDITSDDDMNIAATKKTEEQYMNLPQSIRLDLVERALMASKNPLVMEYKESENHAIATEAIGELEEEYKRLKRSYVKKIEKYKQKLIEKEEEVQAYADELAKFTRVPAEHRVAPLVSDYTFREHPEYDQYGRNLYGEEPPMALPRIGDVDQQIDGWIYRENRYRDDGNLEERTWPMYYYKAN